MLTPHNVAWYLSVKPPVLTKVRFYGKGIHFHTYPVAFLSTKGGFNSRAKPPFLFDFRSKFFYP